MVWVGSSAKQVGFSWDRLRMGQVLIFDIFVSFLVGFGLSVPSDGPLQAPNWLRTGFSGEFGVETLQI